MSINEQEVQALTAEELIKEVVHELRQKSAVATTWIEVLVHEDDDSYGFTSNEQKKALKYLQKEIKTINLIYEMMDIWLQGQQANT